MDEYDDYDDDFDFDDDDDFDDIGPPSSFVGLFSSVITNLSDAVSRIAR